MSIETKLKITKFKKYLNLQNLEALTTEKRAPLWVRQIASSKLLTEEVKKEALNQWIKWENGERIIGGLSKTATEVDGAFVFAGSPQGSEFWHKITNKLRAENE